MPPRSASPPLVTAANGVTACLITAAAALFWVEAIGPTHALLLACAILYGRWPGRLKPHPRLWDAMALGALLCFPIDLMAVSRNLITAALRLLTFVVIYRCSNLFGHRELRQAVSLSFVQVLAAAASTTDVGFSLLLAAYMLVATWTLMALASSREEAVCSARRPPAIRPALALTGSSLAIGLPLFFLIPHFGTGYFQQGLMEGQRLSGFTDRIELGSISRIKRSQEIVMRVRPLHPRGAKREPRTIDLRWRGVALDTFDGRSWSAGRSEMQWLHKEPDGSFILGPETAAGQSTLEQEISMSASMAPILFAPPGAARIVSDDLASIGLDAGGAIHLPAPRMSRFEYRVGSRAPRIGETGPWASIQENPEPFERGRYLTLPRLDPGVEALSRQASAGAASDLERARRIEEHLRSSFHYTLEVNDAGVADPVAHFLLEGNPGHCEYFATGMAVMLRQLGIPSRVVTGFARGEWSDLTETYVVRQADAHSWVEAWLPETGWTTFDPTPTGPDSGRPIGMLAELGLLRDRIEMWWDKWIIGLDLLDQQAAASDLADAVRRGWAAAASALAGAARAMGRASTWSWPLIGALAGAAALVWPMAILVRRTLAWWGRVRARILNRPAAHASSPASSVFRRFEAQWASRGIRRASGQTPLEFAKEIERRALDAHGSALLFVSRYYRTRYGA